MCKISKKIGRKIIYLDNAATTPVSKAALKALYKWNKHYGNSESVYEIGRESSRVIEETRKNILSKMTNDSASNGNAVIFTSGGSEGNTTAIKSMVLDLYKKGAPINICLTGTEHHSVINSVKWAQRCFKAKVFYFPMDKWGHISDSDVQLEGFLKKKNVTMVSIILTNNETGVVQNLKPLLRVTKSLKISTHVDAVQYAPHFGICGLATIGADYITFSGHKLGAPKGIGVLYCAKEQSLISLIEGGQQEYGKRGGTLNVGLISALNVAIDNLKFKNYKKYIDYINNELIIPCGLSLNTPLDKEYREDTDRTGILNIDCGVSAQNIVANLSFDNICVSTGSACDSDASSSYVLKKIRGNEASENSIRISMSPSTTLRDIKKFVKTLGKYLSLIRTLSAESDATAI